MTLRERFRRCENRIQRGLGNDIALQLVVFANYWVNSDVRAASLSLEDNGAVNKSIKSVVSAHTYVCAWVMHCATLALDDVTSFCERATKNFNAKSFAF